jgi:GTP-binding protein
VSRRIQYEARAKRQTGELPIAGTLAIVGRPNVGKSTLFNRLVGSRRAIVGDEPGITRDRLYGEAEWAGKKLRVVDTGGIIPDDSALIPSEIFRQAKVALEQADVIVMVVDGRTELASPDIELARQLVRMGKPLLLAVNKMDTPQLEPYAQEFRRLGIKELLAVSAETGNGVAELLEHVFAQLPEPVRIPEPEEPEFADEPEAQTDDDESSEAEEEDSDEEEAEATPKETKVAIIGRPNVGKSTLLNALTGTGRGMPSMNWCSAET